MSINSAMLAGVSGLVANSSALAAISDNIANVNTVGYKRNQINFANVVTGQSVRGRYSAGGVQGQPYQYVSQQGLLQTSSSPTDIASFPRPAGPEGRTMRLTTLPDGSRTSARASLVSLTLRPVGFCV